MIEHNGHVYSSMADEAKRLQELHDLQIIDSDFEEAFDRITNTVSQIFNVPTCLISLVTEDRQWFKSCFGLAGEVQAARGTERSLSFCQYVIATKRLLVVEDSRHHPWFRDNPVSQGNMVLFYAGAPIETKQGNVLGTLCIIDSKPRQFPPEQQAILASLASWVVSELELRKRDLQQGATTRGERISGMDGIRKAGFISSTIGTDLQLPEEDTLSFQQGTVTLCSFLWKQFGRPFTVYWHAQPHMLTLTIRFDSPHLFLQEALSEECSGMALMRMIMDEVTTIDAAGRYELRFRKKIPETM